jgi:hypothetical protein
MNINQQEYNVALQQGRIIHTKINILNFDFQVVGEISGVVLDGSTYTIDATSDIRRTCSISLIPKDRTFNVEYGSNIWMDKYIQVFIGIEDNKNNNEIVYSNLGLYLINNPEQVYDAVNDTITINGIDLMAKMTGMRNGYLEGIEYQVPVNSGIKQAMTALVNGECGFTKYSIDQPEPTILTPYELSFGLGSTAYNILTQLRDINSNYQTYFDQDGIFWFNRIPNGSDEQIMVDDEVWKKVLISYKKSYDFENVKNYIEVFGKTQDDGHTPYGVAWEGNPDSPFYVGEINPVNNKFENEIRIVLSGGEYDNIYPLENYYTYVAITNPSGNPQEQGWYEMINGEYVLTTDTTVQGGKIYYERTEGNLEQFNALAQQRANYELYTRCRLQDQIELTCVPVYWLDVNWLIEITLPNKQTQVEETQYYIIKRINTTLGVNGTQTITLMKYYPFYPFN